jgi:hypothetical protein
MSAIVDTSIWVDYLRAGNFAETHDHFIDENLVVKNDLIFAELVPYFKGSQPLKANFLSMTTNSTLMVTIVL